VYCLNVGGVQIDQAVVDAFLKALTPAALEATQLAIQQLEANHDAALVSGAWRWNVLFTMPNVPSVDIVRWNPKTGSWHVDWKRSGKNACAISLPQKRSSSGGAAHRCFGHEFSTVRTLWAMHQLGG
jgi:hypothetical protein